MLHCLITFREDQIITKWKALQELLDKKRRALNGFHDLMGMFREIEGMTSELKDMEVSHSSF